MITVIYSNMGDDDCRILQRIWRDLPDVRVIEITPETEDYEDEVDAALAAEDDTLILCGHGTGLGLLYPNFDRGEYIVHENNAGLIHAQRVICDFCYASSFCERVGLHAFATSMFISNVNEAYDNCLTALTQDQINANSERYADELNALLRENVPLDEWVMRFGAHIDVENEVDVFNRQGLCLI